MAILSLAAFYAPDGIPEELFPQAAEYYPARARSHASGRYEAKSGKDAARGLNEEIKKLEGKDLLEHRAFNRAHILRQ